MASQSQHTTRNRRGGRAQRRKRTDNRSVAEAVTQAIPAVLGGALLVGGLKRRSLPGIAMAIVGGWLVSRSLGGDNRLKQAFRSRTGTHPGKGDRAGAADTTAVSRTVTVGKSPEDVYETWRDPEQFSRIMGHFADITWSDEDRLRWSVHGPRGRDFSWETRIVADEPGEFLRWETSAAAFVPNEGSVRFRQAPGDRGTEVTLSVSFDPPGGVLGEAALKRLASAPETLVGEALHRFKSLVESGEIPTLEGNPSARGKGDLL